MNTEEQCLNFKATSKLLHWSENNLKLMRWTIELFGSSVQYTVVSRYYDVCYSEILLIMISNLYPNHYQII